MLTHSEACERNKQPILEQLERLLEPGHRQVLEIGSGTGQHAEYFARALPELTWQCSDVAANLASINARLSAAGLQNCPAAIELDLAMAQWPMRESDCLYTANTLHIVSWPLAQVLLERAGTVLSSAGLLIIYGPFNYDGQYTSPSNADFDQWLMQRDRASGIRDFEAVCACLAAAPAPMQLLEDIAMPANNRLLVFRKS